MRSLTDDCWKAIEYLDNQRKKLEEKKEWTDAESIMYEELGAYCSAINAALEEIDFYKERDVILIDRYGQDAIESAGMAWYHLKAAKTNELLGFTQEDIDEWNKGENQSD